VAEKNQRSGSHIHTSGEPNPESRRPNPTSGKERKSIGEHWHTEGKILTSAHGNKRQAENQDGRPAQGGVALVLKREVFLAWLAPEREKLAPRKSMQAAVIEDTKQNGD
jgi:hypothetical protein